MRCDVVDNIQDIFFFVFVFRLFSYTNHLADFAFHFIGQSQLNA
jgi:hypothetical protein